MALVPRRATLEESQNPRGQYTQLTEHVFTKEWGLDWDKIRSAKARTKIVLSGERFRLETLEGVEKGILHERLIREFINTLILSRNQLTDVSALNKRRSDGKFEFKSLTALNLAHNNLTQVSLEASSLMMINLSHNNLHVVPDFGALKNLFQLILSHNRIDSTMIVLRENKHLAHLDLSHNELSWKPSTFRKELDSVKTLDKLYLWPNPCFEYFREYQFITVHILDSLHILDGWQISKTVREQVRAEYEKIARKDQKGYAFDFSIFDIKVEERQATGKPMDDSSIGIVDGRIPCLRDMLEVLGHALDFPNELVPCVVKFEELVQIVWQAPFSDRKALLELRTKDGPRRKWTTGEESMEVGEFADKIQQMLSRFDSQQEILIMCLVRLMACGSTELSLLPQKCATILAEWIEASASDFQDHMFEVSLAIFRDIRAKILAGLQSVKEDPRRCFEVSSLQGSAKKEDFWGENEDIAETACVLRALTMLGPQALYTRTESPVLSPMLRPFLPALCREKNEVTYEAEDASEGWAKYDNFDAFAEDDEDPTEFADDNVDSSAREKCVRLNCGGFVCEDAETQGYKKVYFKKYLPLALVGMRRKKEGRTLHTRPWTRHQVPRRPHDPDERCEIWNAWRYGLQVLVAATEDRINAASAVTQYDLHVVVCKHINSKDGFTDSWMSVTPEAAAAFVWLLKLAENLINAAGEAGTLAARYFADQELPRFLWIRCRFRLAKGKESFSPMDVVQVSMLGTVICAIAQSKDADARDKSMDMAKEKQDVFGYFLNAAAEDAPDPLMFATALEIIYIFLDSDRTRSEFLQEIVTRLHDGAVLLPYIKGPKTKDKDQDNVKYQLMWQKCEVKYGIGNSALRERIPQLFQIGGRRDEKNAWQNFVPPIKELENPVMHRVLIAIVRLISLFLAKAGTDKKLKDVNQYLDESDRDELLIGPTSGLVTCPQFEIKILCLKCIASVLDHFPDQFAEEEMGMLLRYLTHEGMGVGKQEDFLKEVLHLVTLLTKTDGKTGGIFRQRFAKSAIREAFEMLRVNVGREVHGNKVEEEDKNELSLQIVELLQASSHPRGSALRKFLRRADFLKGIIEIIQSEDQHGNTGCQDALLRTWTGRDMMEVLVPLVSHEELNFQGLSRFHACVRLADVLQGKRDAIIQRPSADSLDPDQKVVFIDQPMTNELHGWQSVYRMKRSVLGEPQAQDQTSVETRDAGQDAVERDDWRQQQENFVLISGLSRVLDYADRFLSSEEFTSYSKFADERVQGVLQSAEQLVKEVWQSDNDAMPRQLFDLQGKTKSEQVSEPSQNSPKEALKKRLDMVNSRVVRKFHYNLNLFHESDGGFNTLESLADTLLEHFKTNQKRHQAQYTSHKKEYNDLMNDPEGEFDKFNVNSKLKTKKQIEADGEVLEKFKQREEFSDYGNSKAAKKNKASLSEEVQNMRTALKRTLIQAAGGTMINSEAETWVKATPGRDEPAAKLGKDIAPWLKAHEAVLVDSGKKEHNDADQEKAFLQQSEWRYNGKFNRMKDLAKITIEFPSVVQLLGSVKAMTESPSLKFEVKKIRNYFKAPYHLGRRAVNVLVSFKNERNQDDLGVLCFVIKAETAGVQDKVKKALGQTKDVEQLRTECEREIANKLRNYCHVKAKDCDRVAEYVMFEMESRALRNGDRVLFQQATDNPAWLEVTGTRDDRYLAIAKEISESNLFIIEKVDAEAKGDILKDGDVVRIKSVADNNYIDVATNGIAHCRHARHGRNGIFDFHVHFAPKEGEDENAVEDRDESSWFGGAQATTTNKRKGVKRIPREANLHSQDKVRIFIKARGKEHFFTAWGDYYETDNRVKVAERKDAKHLPENHTHFIIVQEGSMIPHLDEGFGLARGNYERTKNPAEQKRERLEVAYMRSELPGMPRYGGAFHHVPVLFRTMASTQVGADGVAAPDYSGKMKDYIQRFPQVVAALARCAYALIVVPKAGEARAHALDAFLGGMEQDFGVPTRFLKLAYVLERLMGADDEQTNYLMDSWFSAKLLRLFSTVLANAPPLSMPAGFEENPYLDREVKKKQQRAEESGVFDKQQLVFVGMLSNYMTDILVMPLRTRLNMMSFKNLDVKWVALLYEFARAVEYITFVFLGNELRNDKAVDQNNASVTAGASAQALAAEAAPATRIASALPESKQVELFSKLVPKGIIQVLVKGMLYGIHQEAFAFRKPEGQEEDHEVNARMISSLVNRTIDALALVMHARSLTEETQDEDYLICEEISRALSDGAQKLPHARINQLMIERRVDEYRRELKPIIQRIARRRADAEDGAEAKRKRIPNERIQFVAIVYMCAVKPDAPPVELRRCILAVTSRQNLALLAMRRDTPWADPEDGSFYLPPADRLEVMSVRNLSRLKWTVEHARMRQFIGLAWDMQNAGEGPHEAIIFESANRRRAFDMLLQVTHTTQRAENPKGGTVRRRGIPVTNLHGRVLDAIQKAVKSDPVAGNPLVNMTFVRGGKDPAWPLDLMVLTDQALALVSTSKFLESYGRLAEDHKDDLPQDHVLEPVCEETDSEDDEIPRKIDDTPEAKVDQDAEMFELSKVEGVIFLATGEPQVNLAFKSGRPLEVIFCRDGERHRFRRQLHQMLTRAPELSKGQQAQDFLVADTADVDVKTAKKAAMKHGDVTALSTRGRAEE